MKTMEQDIIEKKALDIQKLNVLIADLKKTNDLIAQVAEAARGASEGRTVSMWFSVQTTQIAKDFGSLDDIHSRMAGLVWFGSYGARDKSDADVPELELSNGNALRILGFVMEGLDGDRRSILKKINEVHQTIGQ